MQLYTPQVQLFHNISIDGPDLYYLHIVTFTDQTQLVASGHDIPSTVPDENDTIKVHIRIQEELDRPNMISLNPVVHTIDVGPILFEGEGHFEVELLQEQAVAARSETTPTTTTTKGNTKVSTTSSKKVDRPMGDELVVPVLFP